MFEEFHQGQRYSRAGPTHARAATVDRIKGFIYYEASRLDARSRACSPALGPGVGCGGAARLVGTVVASVNFRGRAGARDVPLINNVPVFMLQDDKLAQHTFSPSCRT